MHDVLIIGAGLSGLVAAGALGQSGASVLVVDKGRSVGGRLATRRIGSAVLDHGAQFFTTRSESFTEAASTWVEAGVVSEWCRGFEENDGHPRYRTNGGMNQLAKHLRQELPTSVEVITGVRAQAVIPLGEGSAVSYDGAVRSPDEARAVISSCPVPQTLELLGAGGTPLPDQLAGQLAALRYHPVIALLATLDRPAGFGPHGARQSPDDPVFTFCADNALKGISDVPAATFHTAHELSSQLFDLSDSEIEARLRPHAEAILDQLEGAPTIESFQVKKWRYAGPVEPWPERCLVIGDGSPVVLCGDAFGGPKVEGAFLSGRAAADALIERR
jgi:predicted NAD/FAD-dependent oxidoreductase